MSDVKSFAKDTESLDAIVRAFYEIVSGPAGSPRQWKRDLEIHAPGAKILLPVQEGKEINFSEFTLEAYHRRADRHERTGFFEEEIHRVTQTFSSLAHVWSTYQWRIDTSGPVQGRGINSIQLYFQSGRWWISSWVFFSESPSQPIPKDYLPG